MSLLTQSKVLRMLEEQEFTRIEDKDTIKIDVRVIAATNKDLNKEVQEGRFREDLFFRLNVVPIEVPPLRERLEDLPHLIDYFVKKYKPQNGGKAKVISKGGYRRLKDYPWPGNIRELKNFIERINIMVDEEEISEETTAYYLGENASIGAGNGWLDDFQDMKLNEAKNEFEKNHLHGKNVDNGIIRTAKENENYIIATLDREIKNKTKNQKLVIRGKKLEVV